MDNDKPTKEELQAVLEELFDRATEHNEQLQKQLAHVRSRVVQLVGENRLLWKRVQESSVKVNAGWKKDELDLQNDM